MRACSVQIFIRKLVCPVLQGQSPEALAPLFAWNTEAVERCIMLSPESARAENVRQLFHASTADHANLGCLLEQAMPPLSPLSPPFGSPPWLLLNVSALLDSQWLPFLSPSLPPCPLWLASLAPVQCLCAAETGNGSPPLPLSPALPPLACIPGSSPVSLRCSYGECSPPCRSLLYVRPT
jgi:hypothetical protein